MSHIRWLIVAVWWLPLALLVSPGHTLAHRVDLPVVLLVCVLVLLMTLPLRGPRVQVLDGPMRHPALQWVHGALAAVLLVATLAVLAQLVAGGGNIRENREAFEEEFRHFNYLFVLLAMPVIVAALSRFAPPALSWLARTSWLAIGGLLLLTGNRQFVFFSLVVLLFHRVAMSPHPRRTLARGAAVLLAAVAGAYFFSLARLDYVQADTASAINLYLARLTGAECTLGAFCDSAGETLYQLFYAYLGMQYSGIGYALEYHQLSGGFPVLSVLAPVLHRRLEGLTMSNALDRHIAGFDQHIATASGTEFSNFFVSMFGSAAQAGGLVGILVMAMAIFLVLLVLLAWLRQSSNEATYLLVIVLCATMVGGFMQYPFSEPFLFFGLLTLLAHQLLALLQAPRGAAPAGALQP